MTFYELKFHIQWDLFANWAFYKLVLLSLNPSGYFRNIEKVELNVQVEGVSFQIKEMR